MFGIVNYDSTLNECFEEQISSLFKNNKTKASWNSFRMHILKAFWVLLKTCIYFMVQLLSQPQQPLREIMFHPFYLIFTNTQTHACKLALMFAFVLVIYCNCKDVLSVFNKPWIHISKLKDTFPRKFRCKQGNHFINHHYLPLLLLGVPPPWARSSSSLGNSTTLSSACVSSNSCTGACERRKHRKRKARAKKALFHKHIFKFIATRGRYFMSGRKNNRSDLRRLASERRENPGSN